MRDETMAPMTAAHLSDGALITLIDREAADGSPAAQQHVDACATCRNRMDALRRQSVALSHALAALDEPAPRGVNLPGSASRYAQPGARIGQRSRWQPALRAAAGILLVAGIAAAATAGGLGVRLREAFLAERAHRPAPPPEPTATHPAASSGTAIAFEAGGELLVIEFAAYQVEGSVELEKSRSRQVRAQVVAEPGDEEMVLMPGRLRIVNVPRSRASYRIMAPSSLRVVVLVESDTLHAGAPEESHRVSLQRH